MQRCQKNAAGLIFEISVNTVFKDETNLPRQ